MPSTDVCPRCHGDGILRRRNHGAIDCPQCGGLGRLVAVTDADRFAHNAGQLPESLRAMMWPYAIHLRSAQRELFAATVLALLQEMPPGAIGPGTITQACKTAQRQVLKGEVQLGGASDHTTRPEVQRKGARW